MLKRKRKTAADAFQADAFQSDAFQTDIKVLWDTASLTFAAVLYTAGITILGVLVASLSWWWRGGYAGVSLVLLVLGLTTFKPAVIRFSHRVIGRLAD